MRSEPTDNLTLTDEKVRAEAAKTIGELLPEEIEGYVLNREMLLNTLIYAAADGKSLHSTYQTLAETANDDTVRNCLNKIFPAEAIYEMQLALNRSLHGGLPQRVGRGRRHIAIDLHDRPRLREVRGVGGLGLLWAHAP